MSIHGIGMDGCYSAKRIPSFETGKCLLWHPLKVDLMLKWWVLTLLVKRWVAVGSELHTKLLLGRMVERSFGVL
jgi:hypothetical protein